MNDIAVLQATTTMTSQGNATAMPDITSIGVAVLLIAFLVALSLYSWWKWDLKRITRDATVSEITRPSELRRRRCESARFRA